MIEVVSHPADLTTWDAAAQPFYLELFGETSPVVDTRYAEVLPPGQAGGPTQATGATPVYEYWWTIGHPGRRREQHGFAHLLERGEEPDDLWADLADSPAARVYVYFPTSAGWRIKELVATVKYLAPVTQEGEWWNKVAGDWARIAPFASAAGSVAGAVPNPVFAGVSTALSAIGKLQINSVPPSGDFAWSVAKVTFGAENGKGVMQGVMWELPRTMFTDLGGRLTGSLAVSFIPSHVQGAAVATDLPVFEEAALLAHAVVYGKQETTWVPGQREFIRLRVTPQPPAAPAPKA